jgi:hypothetical protein
MSMLTRTEPAKLKQFPLTEPERPVPNESAIEAYSQIVALIGDKDSTTRRRLEDILAD